MSFADQLKQERERLGITQAQAAAIVDVPKRTYVEWEMENTTPCAVTREGCLARLGKMPTPSRQVRWQRRKKHLGDCRLCGKPAEEGKTLCERHAEERAIKLRGRPRTMTYLPKSKWENVDWSLATIDIAARLNVRPSSVSSQRAKRAPETLRAKKKHPK